ncbi:MAG: HAMP domain-containing sensor histidine kinase [Kofleriaceae bacterium]
MTNRRTTLGGRLATNAALVAGLAVAVFALIAAVVVWSHEAAEARDEQAHAGGPGRGAEPGAANEVAVELGISLALAAPVVLVLAALATRRLARGLTERIDGVVAQATRMSHDALDERLPLSGSGDELDRLAGALNALFDRLERAAVAQQQFVADASHELRTPLCVLSTEFEVAGRHRRPTAEWEAVGARALTEVQRMSATVEALLRLARAETVAPVREPVAVDELLADAVARLGERGADVVVADAPDDLVVQGDRDALTAALANLLANAVRHTRPETAVTLTAAAVAGRVAITVDDHGPGVAPADRERIFRPFARGTGASDQAVGDGVGLGLSVARRIAASHGGDVTVADAPGGGARFVLTLAPT